MTTCMQYTYDSLSVGDTFKSKRFISAEDVLAYAEITGDDNPIHVDEAHAAQSQFGKRVAHGAFLLGILSKVLGRDFPGHGSIAVSISSKFLRPVLVDSEVDIEIKCAEKIERHKHVRFKAYVYRDGKMAMGAEAVVIPPQPAETE